MRYCALVAGLTQLQGDLQLTVMGILWRLGQATVEDVRNQLPSESRGAYTTVQTVLNRLADRGLIERRKDARAILYVPALSEAEYLSRSITRTLAGASSDARQAALAELIGGLRHDELSEIQRIARSIEERRGR